MRDDELYQVYRDTVQAANSECGHILNDEYKWLAARNDVCSLLSKIHHRQPKRERPGLLAEPGHFFCLSQTEEEIDPMTKIDHSFTGDRIILQGCDENPAAVSG